MKPAIVLDAMDKWPGRTLILLDVDCEVHGSLAPLADIRGDVALYMHPRRRSSGKPKLTPRAGAMVFRPTVVARRFVERWHQMTIDAEFADNDQDALLMAFDTPGVNIEALGVKWCCCRDDECADPVIVHDSASAVVPKVSTTQRRLKFLGGLLTGRRRAA